MPYVSSKNNIHFRSSETVHSLWRSAFRDANGNCYNSMNMLTALLTVPCESQKILSRFGFSQRKLGEQLLQSFQDSSVFEGLAQFEKRVRRHAIRLQHPTVKDQHYLIAITDCADLPIKRFFDLEGIDAMIVRRVAEESLGQPTIPFVKAAQLFRDDPSIRELSQALERNRVAYIESDDPLEKPRFEAKKNELFNHVLSQLCDLWDAKQKKINDKSNGDKSV